MRIAYGEVTGDMGVSVLRGTPAGTTGTSRYGAGVPNDQYFTAAPSSASQRREVRLDLDDLSLVLTTDRGVFSMDRVDPGTRVLLAEAPRPAPSMLHLADVGCGYGPVALVLAHRAPQATVWAIDTNERARELCALNAERAGLTNIRVVAPDEVPDDVVFDGIWSNPPIRIGKAQLHDLLTQWLGALAPGGTAWLVVQKHLGADSLARWLDEAGWPTTRLASRQAYRVLEVGASGHESELD